MFRQINLYIQRHFVSPPWQIWLRLAIAAVLLGVTTTYGGVIGFLIGLLMSFTALAPLLNEWSRPLPRRSTPARSDRFAPAAGTQLTDQLAADLPSVAAAPISAVDDSAWSSSGSVTYNSSSSSGSDPAWSYASGSDSSWSSASGSDSSWGSSGGSDSSWDMSGGSSSSWDGGKTD